MAWFRNEIIFSDPTPAESVKYALDVIRKESDLYPLLSCENCAYYENTEVEFVKTLKKSYSSEQAVNDLDEVIGREKVLKISVWDPLVAADHGGQILPPNIKGLRTMISGYDWLDVSVLGANKGKALAAIAARLGVNKSEIAAFGDHMNDLEMLQASGNAYVTANAYPPLKERVGETIASNVEYGVIQKLKEILNEVE